MPTVFSRIIAGEIPSFKVAESNRFYAFLDIRPINPGHILVVPKRETDEVFDLSTEELSELLPFAQPIARALKIVTGLRVGLLVAGFEVPHAHVHLIPIRNETDLDFGRARSAAPEDLETMQQDIVRAIQRERG